MRYRTLNKNWQFNRVYGRGKKLCTPALCAVCGQKPAGLYPHRADRHQKVGHAVQRNRARRVMRAALSEHLARNIGGYDIILVARGQTPRLKSTQLSKTLGKLFAKGRSARQGRPGPRARRPRNDRPGFSSRFCAATKNISVRTSGHHCRFIPTCSEYAMQALAVHGLVKGLILTVWRLLRCQPFAKFGYDPVPEKGKWVNPERRLTKDNR